MSFPSQTPKVEVTMVWTIKLKSNFSDIFRGASVSESYIFEVVDPITSFCFCITKAPTGNCQLSSIGHLDYILTFSQARKGKEDVYGIIKEAYGLIKQDSLQIIVDVKNKWTSTVEQLFDVVSKQPYESTNESLMNLYIIKLKN